MSADRPRPRRGLERIAGQDIIYCHSCENEWYRDSQDTSPPPPCPVCHDDVVEIVSTSSRNDPREFQQTMLLPSFAETLFATGGHDYHDHLNDNHHEHLSDHLHEHMRRRQQAMQEENRRASEFFGFDTDLHGAFDDDSDPEEADIGDIVEHEVHGPNNTYMYRTISSFRPGGQSSGQPGRPQSEGARRTAPGGRSGGTDPADPEAMMNTFSEFLNGFQTGQAGRSGPETLFGSDNNNGNGNGNTETFTFGGRGSGTPIGQVHRTTFSGPRFRGGTTSFTIATGPIRTTGAGAPGDFNRFEPSLIRVIIAPQPLGTPADDGLPDDSVFRNIMGNAATPDVGEEQNQNAALPPGLPAALHHILSALLGRENIVYGDTVHSDEALDRIITMLMETNPGQRGAPPATQTAIDALERKKVDAKLLGPEGHAECTICISEVTIGEEVVSLPCKHWFHEDCVVMWLKEHNTCPVCRHPVEASRNAAQDTPAAAAASSGSAENSSNRANVRNLFGFGGSDGTGTSAGSGAQGQNSNASTNANANAGANATSGRSSSSGAGIGAANNQVPTSSGSPLAAAVQAAQATARRNQERVNAIRVRAGLPVEYYRYPRETERSASGRRRRDSHSPNPGPPFNSRRHNLYHDYDDILGPREGGPSFTSRPRHRSPSSHGSGGHIHSNPSPNSNPNPYRDRDREHDRDHLGRRDPILSEPPAPGFAGQMPTWMPNPYGHFGGDSYNGNGQNSGSGGNGTPGSANNSGATGGLLGLLNRFTRDSGNGSSSNSRRRL